MAAKRQKSTKKDSTQGAPKEDAGGDSAPPKEAGKADRGGRGKKEKEQSAGRSRGGYPLPVWPD